MPYAHNTISIGPAQLLPRELRALCSCAGLFFADPVCEERGDIRCEVAALAHYFNSDDATYDRHVRTITLSTEVFDQLVQWDRHVANMATCDLREYIQGGLVIKAEPGVKSDPKPKKEDADLAPLPPVYVSRNRVEKTFERLQISASGRHRNIHTALLIAILDTLEAQQNDRLYEQVRSVQQWRRYRKSKGYSWQRVLAVEDMWEQGQNGWEITVGMPLAA